MGMWRFPSILIYCPRIDDIDSRALKIPYMAHLVGLVVELQGRGIGFRSVCDGAIDTTTAAGELVFHIFSARAQFERWLISAECLPSREFSPSHLVLEGENC